VAGYYDPLVALLDHAVAGGFVSPANRGLVVVGEEPAVLLDRMAAHEPPPAPAWISPEES
jgi:predicted Rossmann-fold nucleotide-binding protein